MTSTELTRAIWRKSSRSALNGGSDDCVELAALEDGGIALRDSKQPDGTVLLLTQAGMGVWLSSVKTDKSDT